MNEDPQNELAQAEARAKYYESQCDYLVRLLPNPTFVIDPENNRYVEVSQGYCELLGYRADELCSTIRPTDIHPDELAQFQEFGEEVRRNGFAVTEQLTCLTSNGRNIPVKVYATVTPGREGDTLVRAIVVETLDRRSMEVALHDEVKTQYDYEDIIGESVAIREMLQQVDLVSQTDASVLILGETGTGKELICRAIHHRSRRGSSPLVKLNCAAIPSGLVESELFGHEKGAFTGAISRKFGRFELAHRGTIFLDEIGDIPLELQPKILRVLQEWEFERVGGTRSIKVDTRLIAATHRNLEKAVSERTFREDLFYRLNVFPITLPPLRARAEDIPLLTRFFANRVCGRYGWPPCEVTETAMQRLVTYPWPGNVRELENVVERAIILSRGQTIESAHIHVGEVSSHEENHPIRRLKEAEREHILSALDATKWKVSGPGGAAELLDVKPTTLEARMKKLNIVRNDPQTSS